MDEFPGWVEVKHDDFTRFGDEWVHPRHHPEIGQNRVVSTNRILGVHYAGAISKGWKLFRAIPNYAHPPRRLPIGSHFSKPVPLP